MHFYHHHPRFSTGILLLLAMIIQPGCAVFDSAVTPLFMISTEEEQALGNKVEAEIVKQMQLVKDPTVVAYVRRVGNVIQGNSPEKAAFPTEFYVVNNEEINAFAIPGGKMYVHTGLINAARDEAELAAVMAHEYGHVVYRHSARQLSRQMGLDMVHQLVLGQESAAATQILSGLVSQGVITRYSREDELQADSIAVPTLAQAGYDPNALVTIFETLQSKYGDKSGVTTWFSSHPATAERIDRARAQISQMPQRQFVRPTDELTRIKARLQSMGTAK